MKFFGLATEPAGFDVKMTSIFHFSIFFPIPSFLILFLPFSDLKIFGTIGVHYFLYPWFFGFIIRIQLI